MLSQLTVKNLAVVEKLDLFFEAGMSAVTGETGAGKSILLQALSLVLGVRGDSGLVRQGKDKADINAVFDVENNKKVQDFLKRYALEDDGECILRRIVGADGKSKAFINGNSVTLSLVRGVGELLVDMHGQNEHQLLLRPDQQLILLDNYAQLGERKVELNLIVAEYKALKVKIDNLRDNQALVLQQQALYTHQLDELNEAQLEQNELDSIEADFKVGANAQALIEKTSNVLNQLESETGINVQLSNLSHELSQALAMDGKLSTVHELLDSAQLQTQESVYELNNYLNTLSIDEASAAIMEARISELHNLGRKHNCQIADLLSIKTQIEQQLNEIGFGASSIEQMSEQLAVIEARYQAKALQLSKSRLDHAKQLSKRVSDVMQVLGMPSSEFKIDLPSKPFGVHLNGSETVEFLVKTNMGQDFKRLKKVASGGELSRISLAISVISNDSEYTPILIFDEVDVGISGAVAEIVGKKLRALSANYQVICITHLAQVAAFAHQHLRASKTQQRAGVQTTVEQLSEQQRIDEIARILGGATITDKARNAAAEMIETSIRNQ